MISKIYTRRQLSLRRKFSFNKFNEFGDFTFKANGKYYLVNTGEPLDGIISITYGTYIGYYFFADGNSHNFHGPAVYLFSLRNKSVIEKEYYLFGKKSYNYEEVIKFVNESGIDVDHITPEDKLLIRMKFEI